MTAWFCDLMPLLVFLFSYPLEPAMSKSIFGGIQSCLFDLPIGREFARLPKILLRMARAGECPHE